MNLRNALTVDTTAKSLHLKEYVCCSDCTRMLGTLCLWEKDRKWIAMRGKTPWSGIRCCSSSNWESCGAEQGESMSRNSSEIQKIGLSITQTVLWGEAVMGSRWSWIKLGSLAGSSGTRSQLRVHKQGGDMAKGSDQSSLRAWSTAMGVYLQTQLWAPWWEKSFKA